MDNTLQLPPVNLCIVQPANYVHSLGLLDPARYLRHQLRRFGMEVTLAKNRLRADAVNIVLGAHLGFDCTSRRRHACLFLNLEQFGPSGASLTQAYRDLLRTSGVIDYDARNVASYSDHPEDVPVIPFLHAPYLKRPAELNIALEERPIDLLFFGSMNERRREWIRRIEATGLSVTLLDKPVYGPERDEYIARAKAVLNIHYYEAAVFEQVRVQHCLSLGTPVISEGRSDTRALEAFSAAVDWIDEDSVTAFFSDRFATPDFFERARARLDTWATHDPLDAYADLAAFIVGFASGHRQSRPVEPWQPARVNLGSGKDYRQGWLNVDILERAGPDLLMDLSGELALPLRTCTRYGLALELAAESVDEIFASNVLEHVSDLTALMSNLLRLLREGGRVCIEVPCEGALTAWQDPTHVRAMNENSWLYYTSWFWYLGWFEHRFELTSFVWLDAQLRPCAKSQAAFMRAELRKVRTTAAERTWARTMDPCFGPLPEDDDDAWRCPKPQPAALEDVLRAED